MALIVSKPQLYWSLRKYFNATDTYFRFFHAHLYYLIIVAGSISQNTSKLVANLIYHNPDNIAEKVKPKLQS